MRKKAFDIDLFIGKSMNESVINEYDYYSLRKKYYFLNTDPFEKYCNMIFNNELIFNTFCQISFIITSTVVNKIYLLSNENEYEKKIDELFFDISNNYKLEKENSSNNIMFNINNNSGNIYLHKLKKKINSKLNLFIYKSKYDKTNSNTTNKVIINPGNNNLNKDNIRYLSKVSGRNLSTHVDNVVPDQKVVNLTYVNNNPNLPNPNLNNPNLPNSNLNNQNLNNPNLNNSNLNNPNINPQTTIIENKENPIIQKENTNQLNQNISNIIMNNNINETIQKQNSIIHQDQNTILQKQNEQPNINPIISNQVQPPIPFPNNLIKIPSSNQQNTLISPQNPIMGFPNFVNPQNQFNNVMNNLINPNFVRPINNMIPQFNNFNNLIPPNNTNPNINSNISNGNLSNSGNLNNIIPPINNQNLISNIPLINNNNNPSNNLNNTLVSNLGNLLMKMKNKNNK